MKKNMLIVSAILFLVIAGIAYAGTLKGIVTAININVDKITNVDTSTITVSSRGKDHVFDCTKDMIPSDVSKGRSVAVDFQEQGNKIKATKIVPIGC